MKKLFSTLYGRLIVIGAVILIMVSIKWCCDRFIPLIVLRDIKSSKLRPYRDGSLMLPWYFAFESASGCVYATKDNNKISVVFPQEAYGETRFSGEVATDNDYNVGVTLPCSNDPGTSCVNLNGPQSASDPGNAGTELMVITGKVSTGLYTVKVTKE